MLDPKITLRELAPGDSSGVVDTVKEVFDEYSFTWEEDGYHSDLYDLERYLDKSQSDFWVAELEGEIVGCGGICYFETVTHEVGKVATFEGTLRIGGCSCEIVRMYVRPKARRMGIGGAIHEKIIEQMKSRNHENCEIWSDKRFKEAHLLYQKFGAKVVGERICDDPDEAPEWGLILSLK